MEILEYIIGGLLLLLAVALVWIIGAQQSKRKSGLSGSIAGTGASESYLAKHNIVNKESSFKKVTLILAIVFIVLVVALYIVGSIDTKDTTSSDTSSTTSITTSTTVSATVSDTSATTSASSEAESAAESVAESVAESTTVSE